MLDPEKMKKGNVGDIYKTDVWSFGVMMFKLVFNAYPYKKPLENKLML
jgi:hypothetical protein